MSSSRGACKEAKRGGGGVGGAFGEGERPKSGAGVASARAWWSAVRLGREVRARWVRRRGGTRSNRRGEYARGECCRTSGAGGADVEAKRQEWKPRGGRQKEQAAYPGQSIDRRRALLQPRRPPTRYCHQSHPRTRARAITAIERRPFCPRIARGGGRTREVSGPLFPKRARARKHGPAPAPAHNGAPCRCHHRLHQQLARAGAVPAARRPPSRRPPPPPPPRAAAGVTGSGRRARAPARGGCAAIAY